MRFSDFLLSLFLINNIFSAPEWLLDCILKPFTVQPFSVIVKSQLIQLVSPFYWLTMESVFEINNHFYSFEFYRQNTNTLVHCRKFYFIDLLVPTRPSFRAIKQTFIKVGWCLVWLDWSRPPRSLGRLCGAFGVRQINKLRI